MPWRRPFAIVIQWLALALAGLVVTVGVAWGFAAFAKFGTRQPGVGIDSGYVWTFGIWEGVGAGEFQWSFAREILPPNLSAADRASVVRRYRDWEKNRRSFGTAGPVSNADIPEWAGHKVARGDAFSTDIRAAGWPMRAFRHRVAQSRTECPTLYSYEFGLRHSRGTMSPGSPPTFVDARAIPVQPVWTGLLIDWALYTIILVAFFWGISILRRRLLMRAGLCLNCRYDLAGVAGPLCPECGHLRTAGTSQTPSLPQSPAIKPPS